MDADGPTSTLTVTGPDLDRRIPLSGGEVIIGRSEQCDVVLPGRQVSRLHARLFRDPLGRWVVEDLNSKRGVRVGGQPIVARVVAPGEPITVGPYAMALEPPPVLAGPAVRGTPMPVLEDPGTKVLAERERTSTTISEGRLHQLNVVSDRLAAVERAVDLYPEVCRALAEAPGMVALVLRLPDGAAGSQGATESLACHVGGAAAPASPDASGLRLSRRVLEAVRSRKRAVIASNTALGGRSSMELTLVDEACPRTVVCAPVTTGPDVEEVLYVDLPAARAGDDVLDFIQAVVRQVRFVQKSLVMAEEREKRRLLDYEIERAADIQSRLTPTGVEGVPGVDVAVHYQPAMWVGGDYCDIWRLSGDALAFAVGDVSGHGFAAAMVMSNLHAALRSAMGSSAGPALAIQQVSAYLRCWWRRTGRCPGWVSPRTRPSASWRARSGPGPWTCHRAERLSSSPTGLPRRGPRRASCSATTGSGPPSSTRPAGRARTWSPRSSMPPPRSGIPRPSATTSPRCPCGTARRKRGKVLCGRSPHRPRLLAI